MVKHKNLLAVSAVVICCITVIWFSTTTHGRAKTYEIQPRVSVPQYKTDAYYTLVVHVTDDPTSSNYHQAGLSIETSGNRVNPIQIAVPLLWG